MSHTNGPKHRAQMSYARSERSRETGATVMVTTCRVLSSSTAVLPGTMSRQCHVSAAQVRSDTLGFTGCCMALGIET